MDAKKIEQQAKDVVTSSELIVVRCWGTSCFWAGIVIGLVAAPPLWWIVKRLVF